MVKAPHLGNDYNSKDCVNLSSSTAVLGLCSIRAQANGVETFNDNDPVKSIEGIDYLEGGHHILGKY